MILVRKRGKIFVLHLKKTRFAAPVVRGGGTGEAEAAASPNFRGLLNGNCNDFGKKKGKNFRASPKKNLVRRP